MALFRHIPRPLILHSASLKPIGLKQPVTFLTRLSSNAYKLHSRSNNEKIWGKSARQILCKTGSFICQGRQSGLCFGLLTLGFASSAGMHLVGNSQLLKSLRERISSRFSVQCSTGKVVIIGPPCSGKIKCEHMSIFDYFNEALRVLYKFYLLVKQTTKLCLIFVPLLLLYPLTFLNWSLYSAWLGGLYYGVQASGPIFIKLGQWAATRRDLFSREFCEQFSELHVFVKPHSWGYTHEALCTAYGRRWHEVLKINPADLPIGSGCVGQVYKGFIHKSVLEWEYEEDPCENKMLECKDGYYNDGVDVQNATDSLVTTEPEFNVYGARCFKFNNDPNYLGVAVKVLHPNVREQVAVDLSLMRKGARLLEVFMPSFRWNNLAECVEQFSASMVKQLDMHHEARCMKQFTTDFANMKSIKIPVPVMQLVRRDILVESLEDGEPISEVIDNPRNYSVAYRKHLASICIDALLQMAFVKNFIHGDLHPGNILVQEAPGAPGAKKGQGSFTGRLVLLDCGIVASLCPKDFTKFLKMFTAVVKGEGEVVADLLLQKCHDRKCMMTHEGFRQDMHDIVQKACGAGTTNKCSKMRVSELMSEVFEVFSKHKICLESNFANVMTAMVILEGLARSLDPSLDLLDKATNVLLKAKY